MTRKTLHFLLVIGCFALLEVVACPAFESSVQPIEDASSDIDKPTPVLQKVLRYSGRVLKRYDKNGDGTLQADEYASMRGAPGSADLDGDATITAEEFARYVADFGTGRNLCLVVPSMAPGEEMQPLLHPTTPSASEDEPETASGSTDNGSPEVSSIPTDPRPDRRFFVPSSRLPAGLPGWFLQRDTDGDGQLTIAEFAADGSKTQFDQFALYDLNRDGMMTAAEYMRATKTVPSKTR